ncbi:MAG: RdgB/HAM1 family non-canonical purine NTP pyrophosphatase [Eubacteriales bacterium]|nr:RdgB/HAM1 family non-canonical purine NTP pyrophosphatase [Eubacteriales bacterium]
MRVVFATNNKDKAIEVKKILDGIDVYTLKELGIESNPDENGDTFAANARIKAMDVYEILKARGEMKETIVAADDSGICIDFLNGEPGVKSARFLGHQTSYTEKNRIILELLKDAKDEERGASFVCHVTFITEDGTVFDAESEMKGKIAYESKGEEGFGYDPIFFLPEFGKTSGELTREEKNVVSHRGKVFRKMREILCQNNLL